jgi:heterodisulfide reductase subunit B
MAATNPITTQTLAETIQQATGQNIFLCYQCVKCSSGCPLAEPMDLLPNQVMRSVQLNDAGVLGSKTIWLCASCQTCTTRCPQGLDIAGIMDALRIETKRQGWPPALPAVDKFSRLFLQNIGLLGRLYEVGLMAGLNLATGQPLKDLDMGLEMFKRGKLKLIPSLTRPPQKVQPVEADENTVAYYPGCSLHSTAAEYDQTIRAVAAVLGLKLVEPPGWTCCGSSPAHSTDPTLAALLPLRTLAAVEQMGLDSMTAPCSACFARMKAAAHSIAHGGELAQAATAQLGYTYQGTVTVQHLLDTLLDQVGLARIAASVEQPLTGLKVACYYGCLVTRPPQLTQSKHPEYPMKMDNLIRALGAEPVEWSYKTDCCGGSLGLTQTPLALALTQKILKNARDCGADLVVTVCPLCHVNLEARQNQLKLDFQMPVLYLTQLMALAFGLGEKQAALNQNFIDPRPVLRRCFQDL